MTIPTEDSAPRLEETKRIARILRIVQLISLYPQRWSRARLAEELEMSERMIDNDLQIIRHGLKYNLRRGQGGYYIVDGPTVGALHLSIPEALALVLAAEQARQTGTVDVGVIVGALVRLEAALPPSIVPQVRRAVGGSSNPVFGPVHDRGTVLGMLEQALLERRKVDITYLSASRDDALTRRRVAPYHLLPYERSWLLIADDTLRGTVRIFKVDRIQQSAPTDEAYQIPPDFDLATYLGPTWGVLRGEGGPPEDVVLRFSAKAAPWVRDDRWHASQEMESASDGSLVLRFHCGVTHELVRWVLGFGAEVCVELPLGLRKYVRDEAERVVNAGRQADEDAD